MAKTIWKYPLVAKDRQTLGIPANAKLLTVQVQEPEFGGMPSPMLWALVDTDEHTEPVELAIYGTGFNLPDDPGQYIATYQMGPFVWHVFHVA